jgi:hypothetical protein
MKTSTVIRYASLPILALVSLASDLDFGSKSDLWDTSRGTIVTGLSGRANQTFRPENIFGETFTTSDGLPSFSFEDGKPEGFVHYVEWSTPTPVTVTRLHLHAQGDGPANNNGREFKKVRILAKTDGSATYNRVVWEFEPTHPYTFENYDVRLVVGAEVEAVTASQFRAEFVGLGGTFWSGPRVWELDAFAPNSGLDFGVKNDVWDSTQGARVTGLSGRASIQFNPDNMFGATYPTPDGLPSFTFEDGKPAGFVHFVEWQTQFPVAVRSFKLHAQGDGPQFMNGREFDRFRLYTKSPGSSTFDRLLYDFTPTHSYSFEDYATRLVVSDNLVPVASRDFRAEFVDTGVRFWSAPRIWEIDGFVDYLPPNVQAFGALELVWKTVTGKRYRLESQDRLGGDWKAYGEPFSGTGQPMSTFVSSRSESATLFRLVEIP